jgi:hypothetical protein
MYALEGALADAVVCEWAARVAVGTERHARVVRGFHRHSAMDSCVRGFVGYAIWLFAEQIHQDNTDVYPAAPGARRFVKVVDNGFNSFR